MGQEVADAPEPSALAVSAPAGLVVRTVREVHGEGPFREAAGASTIVTLVETSEPWSLAVILLAMSTLIFGSLSAVGAVFGVVLLPLILLTAGSAVALFARLRPRMRALCTVSAEAVALPSRRRLALGDIRRIERGRGRDPERDTILHEVRVETSTGMVVVAAAQTEPQAEYVADLVERAYRAYLRRHG